MFEIHDADSLLAEAETWHAAEVARTTLAEENRVPIGRLEIRYPADYRLPILGGGTATARELGLPLVEGESDGC